jgi:hypothetical protein
MAAVHVGQQQMVKIDIKDFFPSISESMVKVAMMRAGYPTRLIRRVGEICFLNDSLPQGAPTSPFLSNVVGMLIDRRMVGLCKKWRSFDKRLTLPRHRLYRDYSRRSRQTVDNISTRLNPIYYSRYADDLVFSSGYKKLGQIRFAVIRILADLGFRVNPKKVTYNRSPSRMVVCGITVNDKISKPRDTRRGLRAQLHNMIVQRTSGTAAPGQYVDGNGQTSTINFASIAGQVSHVKFVCESQGLVLENLLNLAKQAHGQIDTHSDELKAYLERRLNGSRTEETTIAG